MEIKDYDSKTPNDIKKLNSEKLDLLNKEKDIIM